MAIGDKLQDLLDIKQDIKMAIENKDVDLTGVAFAGYAGKINALPAVVELTQAQYDALSEHVLVWGLPEKATGTCASVGYNPIGTACSLEGDKMIVSGEDLGITPQVNDFGNYYDWPMSQEDNSITYGDINSIVDYPSYQLGEDEEVVYVGLLSQQGQSFDYGSTTLHNQIRSVILQNIPTFQAASGNGVARVKLQTYWNDGGMFYEKGVAFIVPFTWTKGSCYELTCISRPAYDNNTYYLIVED